MRAYDWVRRRNRESKKNWAENEKKNYGGLGLDKFRPLARVEGENKTICLHHHSLQRWFWHDLG